MNTPANTNASASAVASSASSDETALGTAIGTLSLAEKADRFDSVCHILADNPGGLDEMTANIVLARIFCACTEDHPTSAVAEALQRAFDGESLPKTAEDLAIEAWDAQESDRQEAEAYAEAEKADPPDLTEELMEKVFFDDLPYDREGAMDAFMGGFDAAMKAKPNVSKPDILARLPEGWQRIEIDITDAVDGVTGIKDALLVSPGLAKRLDYVPAIIGGSFRLDPEEEIPAYGRIMKVLRDTNDLSSWAWESSFVNEVAKPQELDIVDQFHAVVASLDDKLVEEAVETMESVHFHRLARAVTNRFGREIDENLALEAREILISCQTSNEFPTEKLAKQIRKDLRR